MKHWIEFDADGKATIDINELAKELERRREATDRRKALSASERGEK